jgi:hypothetical protein
MAFCVGIWTHVIRGTVVQIPECLSHYAIKAMRLEKLYYIFKYFQIIYASLWQFQRLFSNQLFNCSICFRFRVTYFISSGIELELGNNQFDQLHNPTRLFRELKSIIFERFFAPDYDYVLEFFPARQDYEIIGLLLVKNGLYCNI